MKNIGIVVKAPKETCEGDRSCPFHGSALVRGRNFTGKVIAAKLPKNATVEWQRRAFVPKYERYLKKRTRLNAHNPLCIKAKEGDTVMIAETRKISKTKNFVIVQIMGDKK